MVSSAKKSKIIFIVNPISGGRRGINLSSIINKRVDRNKFDFEIILTEYAGHAVEISKQKVKEETDIIVAVGGDGTINEVAANMIGSKSILGIIPHGSGNGLARHLSIPRITEKAIELINLTNTTKIDTATINGTAFISIAGLGFDAHVANLFANSKRRGFLTYFKIIAENYHDYKPKKYTLKLDSGRTIDTEAFFISFANSNQFGFNTSIAPNAKLNDGKLDICIVKKPFLVEIPLIANLLLLRKINLSPHVEIITSSNFTVSQAENCVANIDGEAIKLGKELHVKVKPLSLNIIIP